jgi:EAL domain-containing protein (putative c-di-GMP-specific phosphodiesterase class I)
VVKRLELKAELERAVAHEQFTLHYQPVVSLESGRVVATEALIRWLHPERGMLPPAEFIDLAEETGLIVPLSRWVLNTACAQARMWREKISEEDSPSVAVNLSPRHIQQPLFVDDVLHALRTAHLPPTSLILELTENVLMGDSEDTIEKLQVLKDMGVRIALDDFGNGFSSLGYLKRFPLDVVKIPKGFVDDLSGGPGGSELVDAMITLGRALGLTVVAEGIEEAVQLQALRVLGCDEGQGFYFARPAAPRDIEALLLHRLPSPNPAEPAAAEKTLRLLA